MIALVIRFYFFYRS